MQSQQRVLMCGKLTSESFSPWAVLCYIFPRSSGARVFASSLCPFIITLQSTREGERERAESDSEPAESSLWNRFDGRIGRAAAGAESAMKGVSSAPGDYVHFKSQVPLHKISIGSKQWRYYDFGPKVVPPLICLPGIAGTADVYYKQIMSLSLKGYRAISVDIPRVWNHAEWIQAFEKFLDAIDVHHVHLYGTSLGGFLAQLFAQHRPRRVRSLVLSNSFLETASFKAAMPWAPIVSWTPSFLLKRFILTGIRDGPHEPFIADSIDFVVSQVETLSRDDLASRLTLNVDAASVGALSVSDSSITIMDTNDYCAIPPQLKDQLRERYPGARRAYLKTGGDFPFLSRSDEVNLHLQLHLRRVGVEARPDLIQGAPREGGNNGHRRPSNDKDEEDIDDPPRDGASSSTDTKDHLAPASDAESSHDLDEQVLSSAKTCIADYGSLTFPHLSCPLVAEKKHTVISIETVVYLVQLSAVLSLLPLCLGVLYTTWKPLLMV